MACHESSDLPPLEEISSSLVPPPRYEDKDIEELLESISLIIADFVANRPLEYMYEDFRQRVLDYTREVVEVLHNAVLEIFSNIDVEYHLEQANYIYFNLAKSTINELPRRYSGDCGIRPSLSSERRNGMNSVTSD